MTKITTTSSPFTASALLPPWLVTRLGAPCRLLCELIHTTTALFHATAPLRSHSDPPHRLLRVRRRRPALLPQSLVLRLGTMPPPRCARSHCALFHATALARSHSVSSPPPVLNAAAVPMPPSTSLAIAYRAWATHPATALVYAPPPLPLRSLTGPIRALIQVDTALHPPSHLLDPPPSTLPSLIHKIIQSSTVHSIHAWRSFLASISSQLWD
ncbi:hypothetical protein B0H14DRAFT_3446173 [Mycena olivaceomarginata]|nr:hypothetical protein B0H14DRAFT_3446173 [Mycena olivaceomarginata]